MAHWADDQVVVELRRRPENTMDVRKLQEVTGLSPNDLEEALTSLREDGVVTENGSGITWVDPDTAPAPAVTPPSGSPDPPLVPPADPGPPAATGIPSVGEGVSLPGIMTGLLEEARGGEPFRINAEAVLETGPNGELYVVGVRRVTGVERLR